MQTPQFGPNRTGALAAPSRTRQMIDGMEEFPPSSTDLADDLDEMRALYAEDEEPIGSVPRPVDPSQAAEQTDELALLVDKLGERLAFERTGARLYGGLLGKLDTWGSFEGGPERDDLERIRNQEIEHFVAVSKCIADLGGDPTAVTPSANLAAQIAGGVCNVIADPRTTLVDGLQAILVAELADNDAWEMLIEIANAARQTETADRFARYLENEEEHLESVRRWLAQAQLGPEKEPEETDTH